MRESLTVLAMLLIVVLTTALVGPYFVDWNAHRGQIEKRLSALVGADVAVKGPIDVKLLPRPIFRMQDVAVVGRIPEAGTASAQRVDMELSLTALLRGEVSFVDADITAPTVTLRLGADGAIMLPQVGEATADRVSLVHLALRDGTLRVTDADGRAALTVGGLTGDGEAESLAGPFKFTGRVDTPRGPLGVHLATGTLENRRMRLKLGLDPTAALPKTDFDGVLTASAGRAGAAGLGLEGALATSGARAVGGSGAAIPWRVTATLRAEPGHAELSGGELRAGIDGRGLIATLAGDVDLGDAPAARLTLRSRQADLGRLVVRPDSPAADEAATTAPSASLADDLAMLSALAGDPDLTAAVPLPVALDLGIETVAAGGLTFGNLNGHLALAAGSPLAGTLSLAAADGSRIAFDGTFEPGPAAVYKGRVEATSAHLQRFAESLSADLPAVAAAIRTALPVDAVALSGTADLSGIGFAAHDVALTLDRSRFAGTVTLTRAVGPDRARLFADLTSDALDLDALPGWRDTARAAADLDVSLTLTARATRLASTDTGGVDAGRVALDLKKTGATVTLDRLSLADIGGATAEFTARSDGSTAHAEGRLDAKRLHDLFTLLDRMAPALVTDALLARADALSPALLRVMADATIGQDGTLMPTLLSLEGTAAATAVTLHLRPDAGTRSPRDTTAPPFALDLTLEAPDTGALLRQAGLAASTTSAVGRGRVALTARRDAGGTASGTLTMTLGTTTLTATGRGDAGRSSTRLAVRSSNIAPLARALMVASPEPSAAWPVEAAATLTADDRTLTLDNLAGTLLGTAFSGKLGTMLPASAAADGGPGATAAPPVSGTLSIDRLPLPTLLSSVLGPIPAAKPGALWPDTPWSPPLLPMLPRGEIAVTVATLPLTEGVVARNAKATLRIAPGSIALADLSATLDPGRIGATATLRRDGAAASLAGRFEWSDLPVASPSLAGRSRGTLDLAGTGNSLAVLMGSLAGSGTVGIVDARLPRFDPAAITRAVSASDAAIDESAIAAQLGQDLDRGALSLGAIETPVTVAAGVMRSDTVRSETPTAQAEMAGTLDLRTLTLSLRATASLSSPPKDWTGGPPQVGVVWKGPFGNPARAVDAATLVNGIAARAIARDQARIEAFQDDIRERAFFARRLRAIEAEQQAARDKARADADAERQRLQDLVQGATDGGTSSPNDTARPPVPRPPATAAPAPARRPGLPAASGAAAKPHDVN